ncbi:hypothetical protein [Corynebacterium callunae]|uniref:Phage head morphogenesis domain-containing protein n=1 Tax=Corynebacterium callunae DSM 20147 TaxID=1121353 RepID=M1TRG6_9CORY|nr:hypothetical protein [Corynebacterium callunae]AGG66886.1 hypothetical protein H924_07220 [Corynebacterium callunae DSM 20147]
MTAPVVDVPRRVDWETLRSQLDWLNTMAMQDLYAVFNRSLEMDPRAAQRYLEEAVADIVAAFGGDSRVLTEGWLDDLLPGHVPQTIPAAPSIEQITAQVGWGTAPMFTGVGNSLVRLSSVVQQHVFGAQRDTVKAFSVDTGLRWGRIARLDSCEFCRVLASRGAVYGSESRALRVGMAGMENHYVGDAGTLRGRRLKSGRVRGEQQHAEKYHDHCRCVVAPAGGSLELGLPDYTERFQEEYAAAVKMLPDGEPITMQAVTRAMRELRK